ncbi:MAG: hypothetical protein FD174_4354 [Geobacteraceae bacterium]|nr:MAG: hypothetical protein FD174_4354 [Geobacteraceae bacterium]
MKDTQAKPRAMPEHIKVESIIGIGHPGETKRPIPAKDLQYEKVKRNRYSGPS